METRLIGDRSRRSNKRSQTTIETRSEKLIRHRELALQRNVGARVVPGGTGVGDTRKAQYDTREGTGAGSGKEQDRSIADQVSDPDQAKEIVGLIENFVKDKTFLDKEREAWILYAAGYASYAGLKNNSEAITYLERAINLNPSNPRMIKNAQSILKKIKEES